MTILITVRYTEGQEGVENMKRTNIYSLISSLSKYLQSAYYMSGSIPGILSQKVFSLSLR